jgi:hypothetical protein
VRATAERSRNFAWLRCPVLSLAPTLALSTGDTGTSVWDAQMKPCPTAPNMLHSYGGLGGLNGQPWPCWFRRYRCLYQRGGLAMPISKLILAIHTSAGLIYALPFRPLLASSLCSQVSLSFLKVPTQTSGLEMKIKDPHSMLAS